MATPNDLTRFASFGMLDNPVMSSALYQALLLANLSSVGPTPCAAATASDKMQALQIARKREPYIRCSHYKCHNPEHAASLYLYTLAPRFQNKT